MPLKHLAADIDMAVHDLAGKPRMSRAEATDYLMEAHSLDRGTAENVVAADTDRRLNATSSCRSRRLTTRWP